MFIFNVTMEKTIAEKKMRCKIVLPIVWGNRGYLCLVQAHETCRILNCFCNGFAGALGCLLLVLSPFFSCLPPFILIQPRCISIYLFIPLDILRVILFCSLLLWAVRVFIFLGSFPHPCPSLHFYVFLPHELHGSYASFTFSSFELSRIVSSNYISTFPFVFFEHF